MMQRTNEISLGAIQAYANLSGYIYLHIPKYVAKHFNITPRTNFTISYRDGKIVVEQKKAGKE